MLRISTFLASCIFIFAHCAGPEPRSIEESRFAISNGNVESGFTGVGIIHGIYDRTEYSSSFNFCTVTMISPQHLLTAAHCIHSEVNTPVEEVVFYGDNDQDGIEYQATAWTAHPHYSGGNIADIGVVTLANALSNFPTYPYAKSTEPPILNEAITVVGYGRTSDYLDDVGTRRSTPQTISKIIPQLFAFDGEGGVKGTTCSGDSGGPTFAKRNGVDTVIGVHSTTAVGCIDEGNDERVDFFSDWITEVINGGGTVVPPKKTFGESCTSADECQTAICQSETNSTNTKICTLTCTVGADTCPTGYGCLVSAQGYVCLPSSDKKAVGESCSTNDECASDVCALQGSVKLCSIDCAATQSCSDPLECQQQQDGKFACVPKTAPQGGYGFGESCIQSTDCFSGVCHPTLKLCTQACDTLIPCPYSAMCMSSTEGYICDVPVFTAKQLDSSCSISSPQNAAKTFWPLALLFGLFFLFRRKRMS